MRPDLCHFKISKSLFVSLTGCSFSWYNRGCNVHVLPEY